MVILCSFHSCLRSEEFPDVVPADVARNGANRIEAHSICAAGEAEAAGADIVGAEDLIARITSGDKDLKFDVILATEEMAPQIGKIGRVLGPRTPNKRNGTVTNNIATAVREIKGATRVEYRAEKGGIVHLGIGKVSFTAEQLQENFLAAISALVKAKPATAKCKYIISITLSSTMGPSIAVDTALAAKAASAIK
jgi:large subunit ribosomal protein L1